ERGLPTRIIDELAHDVAILRRGDAYLQIIFERLRQTEELAPHPHDRLQARETTDDVVDPYGYLLDLAEEVRALRRPPHGALPCRRSSGNFANVLKSRLELLRRAIDRCDRGSHLADALVEPFSVLRNDLSQIPRDRLDVAQDFIEVRRRIRRDGLDVLES